MYITAVLIGPGSVQEGKQLVRHDERHRKFSFRFSVDFGVDGNLDEMQVLGYMLVVFKILSRGCDTNRAI